MTAIAARTAATIAALFVLSFSCAQAQPYDGGPQDGGGQWSGYQRKGSWSQPWNGNHGDFKHDKFRHDKFRQPQGPQIESGWFQRPYPYHLDYYRMKWGGSYAPYFGNLYGPPTFVGVPFWGNGTFFPSYGFNGYPPGGVGYPNGFEGAGWGEAPVGPGCVGPNCDGQVATPEGLPPGAVIEAPATPVGP